MAHFVVHFASTQTLRTLKQNRDEGQRNTEKSLSYLTGALQIDHQAVGIQRPKSGLYVFSEIEDTFRNGGLYRVVRGVWFFFSKDSREKVTTG